MIRGHFIVLEGIDGAGTTTQAAGLGKRFSVEGLAAHVTAEPSAGPVGSIIRQVLTGRLVVRSRDIVAPPSWRAMSLFFAADRLDHVESEIEPNLRDGVNVVSDRYVYSSVIYQSVSSGTEDSIPWIKELNRYAKKPDLVLYLRVRPDEALRRRSERDRSAELFDDPAMQRRLAEAYDRLPDLFSDHEIAVIDGNRDVAEVAAECWRHVERLREKGSPA